MKNLAFLLLFLFSFQLLYGQQEVYLDSCYSQARENYPNLKQAGILNEITALEKENIRTSHLPQITLNGQATYQSEVTAVDISMPGFSVPRPSKDQYKAYAEIRQSIWDGGMSEANLQLEEALLRNHLSELEVEMYQLNEQVSRAFFTVLVAGKQLEVLEAQQKVLEERLSSTKSAVAHGTAEKSTIPVIRAEILNLGQQQIQLKAVKNTARQMLSILTGHPVGTESQFIFTDIKPLTETKIVRPEMQLFDNQISQLKTRMNLLDKGRNPKIFGFGQAGYGKPGLNMLSDQFDTYYLVGAGIAWHPFDWNETQRRKQALQLQQQKVKTQEETFIQNINLLLAQQQEEIYKLEKILRSDMEMVTLRSEIVTAATSKLRNETITTSEYIREIQAETVARLNYELHKIQLNEAREKYNLIRGKN